MDFNNDTSVLSNVAVISSSTNTVTLQGTGGLILPTGITSERPSFANGIARYNSTTGFVEVSSNGSWINVIDPQPLNGNLTAISNLTGSGLLKKTGTSTWAIDSNIYLTQNQTITLTGDVTGSGTGSFPATLANVGTAGTYQAVTTDAKGRVISGSNPTTLSGYGIIDAAPLSSSYLVVANDATLTNERALAGTANQIVLTDNGANNNVVISIAANPIFTGTGSLTLPQGTTAQRSANASGLLRFNSNINGVEFNDGTTWTQLNSGTVTSVGLSVPPEFSVSNSPITTNGTIAISKATQPINTIFAGPVTGGNAVPTFRTISMNQHDLSDVTITSPTANQLLQYNGATWINSTSLPSSISGVLSSWTLVSGSRYYADFTHNLGTNNVVIQLFDNTTNAVINADSIVLTNINTVRITVIGNSRTIRIVVIANGMAVGIMNGGGVPVIIEDLYANRPTAGVAGRLFIAYDSKVFYRDNGTGWDIVSASSGTVKTYTFYANSLDSPTTSDFAVNSLAPVISDPSNTAMNVRSFSNTVEQGVGLMVPVPLGATTMTFKIRGRPTTAPASATTVTHKLYSRMVPTNAAMGTWSAATTFTSLTIPTNAYYQLYTQTYSLAALGLTVNNTYHFELTRATGGLTNNWLVVEIVVEFT
jgi:hypothetical protein